MHSANPNVLTLRLRVPSAASRQVTEEEGGILCIAALSSDGTPALLLIRDEQEQNTGASATNAMETVIQYVESRWRGQLALRECNIVESDSVGEFDHVHVTWNANGPPTASWSPLRWAGAKPRSLAAFKGMFGTQANKALAVIEGQGYESHRGI